MNTGRRPCCSSVGLERLNSSGPRASTEAVSVAGSTRCTEKGHRFTSSPRAGTTASNRLAEASRIRWRENMLGGLGKALPLQRSKVSQVRMTFHRHGENTLGRQGANAMFQPLWRESVPEKPVFRGN